MKKAKKDFTDLKRGIDTYIQDLKDDALKQVEVLQAKIETKSEIYTQSLFANNHSIDAYLVFERKVETMCEKLLSYYRTTNVQFRESNPPKYFETAFELNSSPTLWENKKINVDEDIKNRYEELNKTVNSIEDEIIEQYKLAILEFEKY